MPDDDKKESEPRISRFKKYLETADTGNFTMKDAHGELLGKDNDPLLAALKEGKR